MTEMRPEVNAFMQRIVELGLTPQPQDDSRPITDYPKMPQGTCYLSSRFLAEIFPELRVSYGRLTFAVRGMAYEVDHSWNVLPDGRVLDSTSTLGPEAKDIQYWDNNNKMTDIRLAYHQAADRFALLDVQGWVDRLRAELPATRRQKPVVVWRGQAADRPLGISWTTSRAAAQHFARRHANIAATVDGQQVKVMVVRAVAPPSAVLGPGHPWCGDEGEILIDPSRLESMERAAES